MNTITHLLSTQPKTSRTQTSLEAKQSAELGEKLSKLSYHKLPLILYLKFKSSNREIAAFVPRENVTNHDITCQFSPSSCRACDNYQLSTWNEGDSARNYPEDEIFRGRNHRGQGHDPLRG